MNMMMNSNDDRLGHNDQAQSSESTGNYTSKHRIEYETSPPMLIAMSIGCVVVLLATVIGCAHMCADCDPCISCSEEDEPHLSDQQLTSLIQHEALIQRLTEYPELLQREENQKYILQLTQEQFRSIYKSYCFYFVNTPSHLIRNIRAFGEDDHLHGQAGDLQVRSLPDGSALGDNVGHAPTPPAQSPLQFTPHTSTRGSKTPTLGNLSNITAEDSKEGREDRLRRIKAILSRQDDLKTQQVIQATPKQLVDPFTVEDSTKKSIEVTRAPAEDVLPGNLGPRYGQPSEDHLTGDRSSKKVSKILQTIENHTETETGKIGANPEKKRRRRHENPSEDDDELDNDENIYDGDERGDTQVLSDDEETMCSGRDIKHPVVLFINAAGNLVQLIQSESYYQPLVNERCTREFHTSTRGNLTVTCVTTYRLAQVYALNLVTQRFGREIVKITQCTPVVL